MKLLVAKFILEANAHVPMMCDMEHVALSFGTDALRHMQLGSVFEDHQVEVIPVLCADAGCSGVMKQGCYTYIKQRILNSIQEHLHELDGIYLHLHGASEIEGIGSGDHDLLYAIRAITGPYMPIAIVCDPHGNLCQRYVESATIIRSYREAPHTDIADTIHFVVEALIDTIKHRRQITPIYRKLPMILGGEQSVSTDEPVLSINHFMNELERDERILSCSWHVGYLRHDTWVAGCGIVVVPIEDRYQAYANEVADQLAEYVFSKRHVFHYTGNTMSSKEALQTALSFQDKPVFLSDSGDNVTSGAMGANTIVLQEVLTLRPFTKRFLFAAIQDPMAYAQLSKHAVHDRVELSLGMQYDAWTTKVDMRVSIEYIGRQEGSFMFGEEGDYGGLIRVRMEDAPVDIVITENNHSFVEQHQIEACGVDWDDYDVIIVKQGYLHPELLAKGKCNIIVLTQGATLQDTKQLAFKQILRPMYPIDEL